jgi:hypothetical protein
MRSMDTYEVCLWNGNIKIGGKLQRKNWLCCFSKMSKYGINMDLLFFFKQERFEVKTAHSTFELQTYIISSYPPGQICYFKLFITAFKNQIESDSFSLFLNCRFNITPYWINNFFAAYYKKLVKYPRMFECEGMQYSRSFFSIFLLVETFPGFAHSFFKSNRLVPGSFERISSS